MQDVEKIASELAGNLSPDQVRERWERAQNKYAFSPSGKTPTELEYWQKVWDGEKKGFESITRTFRHEMSFEAARESLKTVFADRANEINALRTADQEPFRWSFDETEQGIIRDFVRYFINDPESKRPLHKGLFIYGAVGTGKTEIMQCFARWAESQKLEKAFTFTSMSAIYTRAKSDPNFDPLSQSVQFDRLFDEFGRYSGNVMNFGNPLDINEAIVEQRYERWQRYGQLTHFIANAEPNDLEGMFSPMVYDRLRQMCTSILFPGKSKRK